MLASAAVKEGLYAQTMPFFGVERRGAFVKSSLRISKKPIKVRSQSIHPNYLVLFDENLIAPAFADGEHKDAIVVISSGKDLPIPRDHYIFDGIKIAYENKLIVDGEPYINIAFFGALAKVLGIKKELVISEINKKWSKEKADPNIKAAKEAFETIKFEKAGKGKLNNGKFAIHLANPMLAKDKAYKGRDDSYFPLSMPSKGAGGKTGTWRMKTPVVTHEKCTDCGRCWIICPEGTVSKEGQKIDLEYCKGCGVCAKECPVYAIEMVR
jgi:2-oxoacid:acceptor oxidoreductase gamma subunit (pyruvate/2-ketoisovalerate family)/2-oxoacid:acceptor oxidoreductase delta subunit (pyruvate/2-ketoisovalerate family)